MEPPESNRERQTRATKKELWMIPKRLPPTTRPIGDTQQRSCFRINLAFLLHAFFLRRAQQTTRQRQQVVHGWFTDPQPFFTGGLSAEEATEPLNDALAEVRCFPPFA